DKWLDSSDGSADSNKPSRSGLPTALALVTQREFDEQGRLVLVTGPGGDEHRTVYLDNQTLMFPYWDSTTDKSLLPIRVTEVNDGGQVTQSYTVDPDLVALDGNDLPI